MNDDRMAVEFEAWWRDFTESWREARDSATGEPDDGPVAYVARLREPLRHGFLAGLADVVVRRAPGWELALATLEEHHDADSLATLDRYASRLRDSQDLEDQSVVCECLRVLVRSGDRAHRETIEHYLLADSIGPFWSSLPWSLWPGDPDLFARSWARYFSERPVTHWRDNAVSHAFLQHPDALARVRDAMLASQPDRWPELRGAILAKLDALWITDEERARLREVCGS